jgi:hypothetical protein
MCRDKRSTESIFVVVTIALEVSDAVFSCTISPTQSEVLLRPKETTQFSSVLTTSLLLNPSGELLENKTT